MEKTSVLNSLFKSTLASLSVLSLLILTGCSALQPEEGGDDSGESRTIKIGGVMPLTGDGAAYGTPGQRVAMIALEEINKQWEAKGKKLEIVWEDGQCTGEAAATAAQKLINVDEVNVILGGFCSGETLGMAPIAEQNKVILFSPGSTNPTITTAGDFVFRNAPSDSSQGKLAAEAAYNKGYKMAGILHEQTDYALGVKDAFEKRFVELGGKTVVDSFTSEATDVRTQILKLKAESPEVMVIIPQTPAKGELVFKQLQEQGIKIPMVVSETVAGDSELLKKYADFLEGTITADLAYNAESEQFKNLNTAYTTKHGEVMPYLSYMATTYDAVYLLAEAIAAEGNNAEKIRDYLYDVKDWKGAEGTLSFTSDGDPVAGYKLKWIKGGVLVDAEESTDTEKAMEGSETEPKENY